MAVIIEEIKRLASLSDQSSPRLLISSHLPTFFHAGQEMSSLLFQEIGSCVVPQAMRNTRNREAVFILLRAIRSFGIRLTDFVHLIENTRQEAAASGRRDLDALFADLL